MSLPEEIGKYRVLQSLGSGHFGQVVLAYDRVLQVTRAIKIVNTGNPKKFLESFKEAQIMERCRHQHIVDIKDADVEIVGSEPGVCLVMEYLQRGSLQNFLETRFVTIKQSSTLVAEALLGLEHAHQQDILHRDIKPGNILISDTGFAKLSDFGLAMDSTRSAPDFGGYYTHLAPEVLSNIAQGTLADLYAMGVTLYRLVTNQPKLAHGYHSQAELLEAIVKKRFPSRAYPHYVPRKVAMIINKAINPDPSNRFQDCLQFRQALEKLRFNIDWSFYDNHTWIGKDHDDEYRATVTKRRSGWDLDLFRNERRTQHTQRFDDEGSAQEQLLCVIRDSTVK